MKEHNTNFYSLENIKETLESCKDFLDGEEVYYHIGALRYAYEEIERLNNIIYELENYLNNEQIEQGEYCDFLIKDKQIKVEDVLNRLKEIKGSDKDE